MTVNIIHMRDSRSTWDETARQSGRCQNTDRYLCKVSLLHGSHMALFHVCSGREAMPCETPNDVWHARHQSCQGKMSIYIYIHIHIQMHIHIRIHKHIHILIYIYIYTYTVNHERVNLHGREPPDGPTKPTDIPAEMVKLMPYGGVARVSR